jgi:hypothetical protein
MLNSQQVTLHVSAFDKDGKPTVLPTNLVWSVSDATIESVTPSADGSACVVAALGPFGVDTVTVSANVNGKVISASLDVPVVAADAASLVVSADSPVDKTTA